MISLPSQVGEPAHDSADETYYVEKILSHRGSEGAYEFLVKWFYYDDTHNSWVKQSDFDDLEFIKRYWETRTDLQ